MSQDDETRRVVEGYFRAWTSKKTEEAFALLAPDLAFSGPTAGYRSAAEFRPALEGFAAMTRSAKPLELVVQGERAAMLYDCELPPPVGTIPISSFFRVVGGRIREYSTHFDATELRKLLAARAGGGKAENPLAGHGRLSYLEIPSVDPGRSGAFYEQVLGWKPDRRSEGDVRFSDREGRLIGRFATDLAVARVAGILAFFYVEGLDAAVARAAASGGEVVKAPVVEGDVRVARVRDPAGNVVGLWQFGGG